MAVRKNKTTDEVPAKGKKTAVAKEETPKRRGRPRKIKEPEVVAEEPAESAVIDETGVKLYDPKPAGEAERPEAAGEADGGLSFEASFGELVQAQQSESEYVQPAAVAESDDSVFEPANDLENASALSFDDYHSDGQREMELEIAQEKVASSMATLVESQRSFFNTNQTLDIGFRIMQLKALYDAIKSNEEALEKALQKDLSKTPFESFVTEIGLVLHEISYVTKHLKKWAKPVRLNGDLQVFPAKLTVTPVPLGVTLILSTWNYPVLLSFIPLVNSIAAGNTAILKTSEYANETNAVIQAIIEKTFNKSYIAVIQGGYTENHALLEQKFDFIFFTGSQNVGRIVMSSAARFLTPVCLELGGKSPCIVDSSANLEVAARRIVWGKFLNAGQTCVAPDYILVDKGIKDRFVDLLKTEILRQFGEKPLQNADYPKIINERRFVHLSTLCPEAEMDFVANKIAPTLIDLGDVKDPMAHEAAVMQEEIFGPLLPILTFENLNTAITFVSGRPTPLSLYLFSTNPLNIKRVTEELRFGGGCVNDVVFHLATSRAPFGGQGESGLGCYHGKYGFETFSHKKTLLVQNPRFDTGIRFAPYKEKTFRLLKKLLK